MQSSSRHCQWRGMLAPFDRHALIPTPTTVRMQLAVQRPVRHQAAVPLVPWTSQGTVLPSRRQWAGSRTLRAPRQAGSMLPGCGMWLPGWGCDRQLDLHKQLDLHNHTSSFCNATKQAGVIRRRCRQATAVQQPWAQRSWGQGVGDSRALSTKYWRNKVRPAPAALVQTAQAAAADRGVFE